MRKRGSPVLELTAVVAVVPAVVVLVVVHRVGLVSVSATGVPFVTAGVYVLVVPRVSARGPHPLRYHVHWS